MAANRRTQQQSWNEKKRWTVPLPIRQAMWIKICLSDHDIQSSPALWPDLRLDHGLDASDADMEAAERGAQDLELMASGSAAASDACVAYLVEALTLWYRSELTVKLWKIQLLTR